MWFTEVNPSCTLPDTEKACPGERNEYVYVVGITQPGIGGPQIGNDPFTPLEGSTVTPAI
jgi:hypothetical protein